MIDKDKVKEIVDEWLADKRYFLTDLTVDQDDRIVVEIDDKEGVWIDDCIALSKYIEEHLDRDEEDYELEVGSAGIGQPFKVMQQYVNHIGDEVDVVLKDRKKFKGVLKAADEQGVTLQVKRRVKPEGAKRAKIVEVEEQYPMDELKSVSYAINFK